MRKLFFWELRALNTIHYTDNIFNVAGVKLIDVC